MFDLVDVCMSDFIVFLIYINKKKLKKEEK